ncbi:hypothetical protein V8C26DRAFT_8562 [Trichoderma gracile]
MLRRCAQALAVHFPLVCMYVHAIATRDTESRKGLLGLVSRHALSEWVITPCRPCCSPSPASLYLPTYTSPRAFS